MRITRISVAAGLALDLVVAGVVAVAGQGPATFTVARDGSGDHETIGAAIAAAAAGDTILISPGEYVENLYIDKPVTLSGDGPREDIVLRPNERDPQILDIYGEGLDEDYLPVTVYVDGVDVTLEHLVVKDEQGETVSLVLMGGSPTVRDIVAGYVGVRGRASAVLEGSDIRRVSLWGPNMTTVRNNTVRNMIWASTGATGVVEGNLVLDRPIMADRGASLEIVGNTIRPLDDELGINIIDGETTAVVTGNDVQGGWLGIHLEVAKQGRIEGNSLSGHEVGMLVKQSRTVVRDNTVSDISETGIVIVGDGIQAEDNMVTGGRIGIHVEKPDTYPPELLLDEPTRITGNSMTGASHFGMVVEGSAEISGNTICARREPLRVLGGDPRIGSNDICDVD